MNNITKVLLSILILAVPYALKAQEVEEVVVTATKKSESIQDLALSIEALSSEDVEANMIQDSDDLASYSRSYYRKRYRFWRKLCY